MSLFVIEPNKIYDVNFDSLEADEDVEYEKA